jgi:hemoglobin
VHRPDLDSRQNIESFVNCFYHKILADSRLAPIFLEVAEVDLSVHLPHIKDYWCKLLLGEKSYRRHTMNIHRQLHHKSALQPNDYLQWLALFVATVDESYAGERAERAKKVARSIAQNMESSMDSLQELNS